MLILSPSLKAWSLRFFKPYTCLLRTFHLPPAIQLNILPLHQTYFGSISAGSFSDYNKVIALPIVQKDRPANVWFPSECASKSYRTDLDFQLLEEDDEIQACSKNSLMCPLTRVIEVRMRYLHPGLWVKLEIYKFD